MSDENNLIQFPANRVKKKRTLSSQKFVKRRTALGLSIVTTIAAAIYLNGLQNQNLNYSSGRDPAQIGADWRDRDAEQRLARDIREKGGRGPASLGRSPSAEDQLRLGELSGRYRLVFSNGRVTEIALIEGKPLSPDPIYLDNRALFLQKYSSIIGPVFDRVELELDEQSSLTDEVYKLHKGDQVVGLARIELDRAGRFRSMKVLQESL